jgi:enoyl-CoA hydratase/carnithine racemase
MELEYRKEGKIAIFTLNRPEALNAFTPNMMRELQGAMEDFRDNSDLWVGIITGAGEKAFCAGADIHKWLPFVKETKDKPWRMPINPMRGMELWKPLIAAINGYAFGGGGELALACDIRIASENASIWWPEAGLGIIPRLGGTQRLPRIVTFGKAAEILMLGKRLSAREAYNIGLVNEVVTQRELIPTVKKWAEKICDMAPLAVRAIKEAMIRGIRMPLEEGLFIENSLGLPLYDTQDYIEGCKAFKEKRKANFVGR